MNIIENLESLLVRKTAKLSLKLRLVIKDIFGIPRIDFGVNSLFIVLGILLFTKSVWSDGSFENSPYKHK